MLKNPELIANLVRSARDSVPRWHDPNLLIDWTRKDNVQMMNQVYDEDNIIKRQTGPFSITAKLRIPPFTQRAMGSDSCSNNVSNC